MESLDHGEGKQTSAGAEHKSSLAEPSAIPTDQDRDNARIRQEIAERQLQDYAHCLKLALGTLGPGWTPWMKLVLLDSEYYCHRGPPVIRAVAYKVYRGELRLTENSVYLMEGPDGVRQADNYEELFGGLLHEPHPTRTLKVRGEQVPAPRWSLCWSAFELYEPRTAEQLAALRVTREWNKVERQARKWSEENPLLAWAGLGVDAAAAGVDDQR